MSGGRFTYNLLLFCRTLRAAGLPLGPGQVVDALEALRHVGLERGDDVRAALRAILVTDAGQLRLFEQLFELWFARPQLLAALTAAAAGPAAEPGDAAAAGLRGLPAAGDGAGPSALQAPSAVATRRERLRQRDFAAMTPAERAAARRLLREELFPLQELPARRYAAHRRGDRYDVRRTMQRMMQTGGEPIEFARRQRRPQGPDLVLLLDISGSMSPYSRAFLQLAHVLAVRHRRVNAFVFGTRLTNVSHRLRGRDPDHALARIACDVEDWDGGTRIAECLRQFNRRWGRRVLAHNATVILLTDGLERDPEADPGLEMRRLRRSCRCLVWLNPMLRYADFEPLAGGIRRMLPHADHFLAAHNLASLTGLRRVLAGAGPAARRKAA